MCQKSVGVISTKTILKNHPFVENAEDEEQEIKAEKDAQLEEYQNAFTPQNVGENPDGEQKGVNDDDAKE